MDPAHLNKLLKSIKTPEAKTSGWPRLLKGYETSDDASVVLIDENTAIVNTVDFFTPILNDPYKFGAVAAANAISDIYAMGAEPISALSVTAFSLEELSLETLTQIMQGAADKCAEAGIQISGGHSIDDKEPKFGLSVTGTAHPEKLWFNDGAKAGDTLVLTKPLGAGVATTAVKKEICPKELEDKVYESMSLLNKKAKEIFSTFDKNIHSVTDVTGFGLAGHLYEMMSASKTKAEITFDNIAVFDGVKEIILKKIYPGGTLRNKKYLENFIRFENQNEIAPFLLFDPQTSGGLLASVEPSAVKEIENIFKKEHLYSLQIIGKVLEPSGQYSIEIF